MLYLFNHNRVPKADAEETGKFRPKTALPGFSSKEH
jgi:hypothetical protein